MSTPTVPSDVMTHDERNKIRSEEIYREMVRKELQEPEKSGGRFWRFLNSSFGLWLLSAVFITGAGSLYTSSQNEAREAAQKVEADRKELARVKELTERLDLEISYRLSSAMARLEAANRNSDRAGPSPDRIKTAVAPISSPMSKEMPPLFPEFKGYSGPALIAELRRHVPEQQDALKEKLASLTGLMATIDTRSQRTPYTFVSFAGELIEKLKDSRWNNGFYYTDCSREDPFC